MRGSTFKRCPHGTTGTPGNPACKVKHGTWWWRVNDQGPDGKRRQPAKGGYASSALAQEALSETLAAMASGTWTDDKNTTLEEWVTKTWLPNCERDLEPKTVAGYRSHCVNVLVPHLGKYRLRDLRRTHVEKMLRALREPTEPPVRGERWQKVHCSRTKDNGAPCKGWAVEGDTKCGVHGGIKRPLTRPGRTGTHAPARSPRTLDSYRRTLRALLAAAKRAGLVSENVAEGRMDALPKARRSTAAYWEPEQVASFLLAVEGEPDEGMYEVAAFTGLRRGELLGLRWEDLELDDANPGLWVRQTLSDLGGPHACVVCKGTHIGRRIKVTTAVSAGAKSEAGLRWVPLVPGTVELLKRHRERQGALREEWGSAYDEHHLVFPLANGEPERPSDVTKRFKARATQAGLPAIKLHEARHGACALLLAAGMPVEVVAMVLGHANAAVTRAVYAHILKSPASEGMRAAVRLVRPDRRAQSVHTPPESAATRPVWAEHHRRSEAV